MSTALIVGGDQIDSIKQVLSNRGITRIDHWSGRKVGDGKKVIPQDTKLIVLITDWISHTFTHKIKQTAAKRGVTIIFTPNGPTALQSRLDRLHIEGFSDEASDEKHVLPKSWHQKTRHSTSNQWHTR